MNTRIGRNCTIALLLTFLAVATGGATAQSNPRIDGISGSFDSGTYITIQGVRFGAKTPAFPVLWDDFEHGTPGEPIGPPVVGSYHRIGTNARYTDEGVHSGSRSLYGTTVSVNNGVVSHWIPNEAKNAFASFVVKINSDLGSLYNHDNKILRLNTWEPDATHGLPNVIIGLDQYALRLSHIVNLGAPVGSQSTGNYIGETEFGDPHNEWFSLSVWGKMGPVGQTGRVGRGYNGSYAERSDRVLLYEGAPFSGYRSAYFSGHMGLRGATWMEYYLDEVYADTTLARVAVRVPGSGPTGPVAMQLPYSWADNEIVVKVNPGRYQTGTQLSLIVWNANGDASEPFTITVGESGGTPPPPPPPPPASIAVNLTSPLDGAAYNVDSVVPLSATASASSGSVQRVEFRVNDSVVATVTQSPWQATWHAANFGDFSISARAYHSNGTLTATSQTADISVSAVGEGRISAGLVGLYLFDEGSGNYVRDRSGVSPSLDLQISNPGLVQWLPDGGLVLSEPVMLSSDQAATKFSSASRAANAVTVEAWIHPQTVNQTGPARIVSISSDENNRNVMLGHGLWGTQPLNLYDARVRTTATNLNGMPSTTTPQATVTGQLQHVVFVRRPSGVTTIYVDGTSVVTGEAEGNLSNWNDAYPLVVGAEVTGDRNWLGTLHLVAVYGRDLTHGEVLQNFSAGPRPGGSPGEPEEGPGQPSPVTMTQIEQ